MVFLKAGTLKSARLESPNVHIRGSRPSKTPPKFHEKTPRERERKRAKMGAGEGKKRYFGRSRRGGGPAEGGSAARGLADGGAAKAGPGRGSRAAGPRQGVRRMNNVQKSKKIFKRVKRKNSQKKRMKKSESNQKYIYIYIYIYKNQKNAKNEK